jgi:hypothetical protein
MTRDELIKNRADVSEQIDILSAQADRHEADKCYEAAKVLRDIIAEVERTAQWLFGSPELWSSK